ncbi:tRNA dihydrouridine synthase [Leptospira sp. GIMC2001]|uniref:tRNA dihydrouridine synthase n=1 Tax=Leptospira sp. GIMC2001 TaxID=1513297 RepID=UPI0023499BAE|nr:tRNA-dihydrouridine synthase [Leptospira sp. GIMC2001]WCL49527.1 tRNA-dihydrouridine synthase [Leptospira sp. GIMC2001]
MHSDSKHSFTVGNVAINGRVCLSPMAGISDSPYRRITREMGAAWSFNEFVSAEQILIGNPKTFRMFHYNVEEKPIWFQIFGNAVEPVVEAAKRIEILQPNVIDLNMGCSVQKVSQRGSGAGLLRNLPLAGKMIEGLCKNLSVPVTAKIRIGWQNDSLNYLETIKVLQNSGVAAISVHGRTKEMGYTGRANWDAIEEIKSIAEVPIFGNGDIADIDTVQMRLVTSKVDAVLVGRGAIGNPWIFSGIDKAKLTFGSVFDVAYRHYIYMKEFYGSDNAVRLFRKHFTKYFQDFKEFSLNRQELLRMDDPYQFEEEWLRRSECIMEIKSSFGDSVLA